MKFNGLIVYIPVIPVCETFGRWTLSLLVACNIWDLWDPFHRCWHSHRPSPVSSYNLIFNHIHHIYCNTQLSVSKCAQTYGVHFYSKHTCRWLFSPPCCSASVSETWVHRGSFLFVKVEGQQQLCDLEVITTLQGHEALIWWFAGHYTSRL